MRMLPFLAVKKYNSFLIDLGETKVSPKGLEFLRIEKCRKFWRAVV